MHRPSFGFNHATLQHPIRTSDDFPRFCNAASVTPKQTKQFGNPPTDLVNFNFPLFIGVPSNLNTYFALETSSLLKKRHKYKD